MNQKVAKLFIFLISIIFVLCVGILILIFWRPSNNKNLEIEDTSKNMHVKPQVLDIELKNLSNYVIKDNFPNINNDMLNILMNLPVKIETERKSLTYIDSLILPIANKVSSITKGYKPSNLQKRIKGIRDEIGSLLNHIDLQETQIRAYIDQKICKNDDSSVTNSTFTFPQSTDSLQYNGVILNRDEQFILQIDNEILRVQNNSIKTLNHIQSCKNSIEHSVLNANFETGSINDSNEIIIYHLNANELIDTIDDFINQDPITLQNKNMDIYFESDEKIEKDEAEFALKNYIDLAEYNLGGINIFNESLRLLDAQCNNVNAMETELDRIYAEKSIFLSLFEKIAVVNKILIDILNNNRNSMIINAFLADVLLLLRIHNFCDDFNNKNLTIRRLKSNRNIFIVKKLSKSKYTARNLKNMHNLVFTFYNNKNIIENYQRILYNNYNLLIVEIKQSKQILKVNLDRFIDPIIRIGLNFVPLGDATIKKEIMDLIQGVFNVQFTQNWIQDWKNIFFNAMRTKIIFYNNGYVQGFEETSEDIKKLIYLFKNKELSPLIGNNAYTNRLFRNIRLSSHSNFSCFTTIFNLVINDRCDVLLAKLEGFSSILYEQKNSYLLECMNDVINIFDLYLMLDVNFNGVFVAILQYFSTKIDIISFQMIETVMKALKFFFDELAPNRVNMSDLDQSIKLASDSTIKINNIADELESLLKYQLYLTEKTNEFLKSIIVKNGA